MGRPRPQVIMSPLVVLLLAGCPKTTTAEAPAPVPAAPTPPPTPRPPPAVSVPVVSDMPYVESHNYNMGKLTEALQAGGVPFVVHTGDYKGAGEPCTDEALQAHLTWARSFGDAPVFYTPGDNDWTDCDRPSLTPARPELEVLEALRGAFFAAPPPGAEAVGAVAQEALPENVRWTYEGVVFSTLHVVGTNNGREEILLGDEGAALDAVDARDAANLAWIEAAFEAAGEGDARAVVFFQQADPTDVEAAEPSTGRPSPAGPRRRTCRRCWCTGTPAPTAWTGASAASGPRGSGGSTSPATTC
jgi:hypothetical protein